MTLQKGMALLPPLQKGIDTANSAPLSGSSAPLACGVASDSAEVSVPLACVGSDNVGNAFPLGLDPTGPVTSHGDEHPPGEPSTYTRMTPPLIEVKLDGNVIDPEEEAYQRPRSLRRHLMVSSTPLFHARRWLAIPIADSH